MSRRQRLHRENTVQLPESFLVLNCSLTGKNISDSFNNLTAACEKSLCSVVYASVILLSEEAHIKNAYICMDLNFFV